IHHATSGDLDRRGVGDVVTLTIKEYLSRTRWRRFTYRFYRHPLVTFFIGPHYIFLFRLRFFGKHSGQRERRGVYLTNAALFTLWALSIWSIGLPAVVLIWVPVQMIAGVSGVWLFYVQHQYEGTYWQPHKHWDYATAALMGSSYYKLPRLLQWFSGNIGFHHVHHLSPRIPNYNLERCHKSQVLFKDIKPVTFFSSFRLCTLRLWDESAKKLIGFRRLRRLRANASGGHP